MNNQFQQNQNIEKPKKTYWKFVLGFLGIVVAVFVLYIAGFWLWQKYDLWQGQKGVQKLAEELKEMGNSEMWKAGAMVRSLRPDRQKKE